MPRSSRISEIVRSVHELAESIHVHGASTPARALIVSELVQSLSHKTSRHVVVVCATDEIALSFAADLESLSSAIAMQSISPFVFPSWEQSPYSPIAPSIRSRLDRVATLCAVSENSPTKQVIVTSLPALCQASIPRDFFSKHSILLKKGAALESREGLITGLRAAGYLRVDTVEDPGTFAVRGEIIDVFPPGRENPVRAELFDDLIERIREFSHDTQRAITPEGQPDFSLHTVLVPPAREVLINVETLPMIRERVKSHSDEVGISRAVRDPILSALNDGIYPDHSDTWAPFAYESPSTLMDFLDENSL